MRYITYNGVKISKLSLGTVQFGLNYGIANKDGKPTQQNVQEITDFVISKGLNCFDTAIAYGNSEEVLGIALHEHQEKIVISKISSEFFEDSIDRVKVSLKNLKQDSLYGLLLHDSSLLSRWENKTTQLVNKLKDNGQIKYFGVSIYTEEDFNLALENDSINLIQIPFNLFDQRAFSNNWFEKAKKRNKLIFIRSIYLQGVLLIDTHKLPEKLKKLNPYLTALQSYAKRLSMTQNQLALSFVNSVAKDSILLFGCETLAQAKENLDIFSNIKELDSITLKKLNTNFKEIKEEIYNPAKW